MGDVKGGEGDLFEHRMFSFTQDQIQVPLSTKMYPGGFPSMQAPRIVHPGDPSDVRKGSRYSVHLRSGCFKLRQLEK